MIIGPAPRLKILWMGDSLGIHCPIRWSVSRELRAYLKSHYEVKFNAGGAVFLTRRSAESAVPPESISRVFNGHKTLASDHAYKFPVPQIAGNEVRLDLNCRFLPFLASLSKAYAMISIVFETDAKPMKGFLPVPPQSLGRDIRFLVRGGLSAASPLKFLPQEGSTSRPRRSH